MYDDCDEANDRNKARNRLMCSAVHTESLPKQTMSVSTNIDIFIASFYSIMHQLYELEQTSAISPYKYIAQPERISAPETKQSIFPIKLRK